MATSLPILTLSNLLSPTFDGCHCIQSAKRSGQRCKRPLNSHDRQRIEELLVKLKSYPTFNSEVKSLLKDLASLLRCVTIHRNDREQRRKTLACWIKDYPIEVASSSKTSLKALWGSLSRQHLRNMIESDMAKPAEAKPRRSQKKDKSVKKSHIPPASVTSTASSPKPSSTARSPSTSSSTTLSSSSPRRLFTSSHTRANPSPSTSSPEILVEHYHEYHPYDSNPFSTSKIPALLHKPLTKRDRQSGHVYVHCRLDPPNLSATSSQSKSNTQFLKIGYTTKSIQTRFTNHRTSCKYDPIPLYVTSLVPHARRIEQLVLETFSRERRRENFCATNPIGCRSHHTEWVEVGKEGGLEKVVEVIERWVKWMLDAVRRDAFDEWGVLRDRGECDLGMISKGLALELGGHGCDQRKKENISPVCLEGHARAGDDENARTSPTTRRSEAVNRSQTTMTTRPRRQKPQSRPQSTIHIILPSLNHYQTVFTLVPSAEESLAQKSNKVGFGAFCRAAGLLTTSLNERKSSSSLPSSLRTTMVSASA